MEPFLISVDSMVARWIVSALLLALIISTGGCAAKHVVLVPATNAMLAPQPNSAQGSSEGVSVQLRVNAWDDDPKTLDKDLVPMEIAIQNDSGRPLAIRYEDFALIAADNRRYSDIPPYRIAGDSYEHLQPYWAYSDAYYSPVRLPTMAMLQDAMSEGVVADHGRITGFLYFTKPTGQSQQLVFHATLVDMRTGTKFGEIVVPLAMKVL
jgi:hypothetical protein